MDAQVVEQHHRDSPALLRAFDGPPQLDAERLRLTTRCAFPIEPAIPAVDQAKAVLLLGIARCLDQVLPDGLSGTRHVSGWDAARSRLRPGDTRRPAAAGATATGDPR